MADVLARIIARKRDEVAQRRAPFADLHPSTRSLKAALGLPGARFIMEVKRRSPSGHAAAHSVADAVRAYAPIADAISVLTDEADFGGSLEDLAFVRARFDGPILAKDFVVDPFQVAEARAAGADAVLAMLSVLDDQSAAEVMAAARRLGMDVVVEVHDAPELARALKLGAEIVGINNRNLKTLATDLSVTERLAPMVPAEVCLIAESGIKTRADVLRLAPLVDGFLVGSALMAATDIGQSARALIHGRIKVCGLTQTAHVEAAARCGATHAGLILVPGTPRAVSVEQARRLADAARRHGLQTVGVFRDERLSAVRTAAVELTLDAVQLHGREDEAYVADLRREIGAQCEVWASRGVEGGRVAPPRLGSRSLFDTVISGRSGGTGIPFEWSLLKDEADLPAAFLSGGITSMNARQAAAVGAYGLDVSSGVEAAPGVKDPAKLQALFAALRPTSRRPA